MAAVATAERHTRTRGPACEAAARADEHATLEAVILGAWDGLRGDGRCECPVCRGEMDLRAARGSCRDCGSALK